MKPAQLWIDLLPKRGDPGSPSLQRRKYCYRVLEILSERHPDLYMGQKQASLSVEEASSLVRILKENTSGHVVKHRLGYLCRGLERGASELEWDVAIPETPVIIPRDKPCFVDCQFSVLPELYAVEEAFLANLKEQPPDTHTARIGQLLVSAVLFGGLQHKRWLAPWVEALSAPRCTSSFLWLNLVLKSEHLERLRKGKISIHKHERSSSRAAWEVTRRWFADPITYSLILRWNNLYPGDENASRHPSPLQAIRSFLLRILPEKAEPANSFEELLFSGAATRLCLQVPPFLVGYAEGENKSVSMPIQVWERLLTGMRIPGEQMHNQRGNEPPPAAETLFVDLSAKPLPQAGQEKLLMTILREILPPDKSTIRKSSESRAALEVFYATHQGSMCQVLVLLLYWCMDMLTHYARHELMRRRVKSSIRASSVRRYLDAVGKRLVAVAGNLDILDLESDELHDLYRDVIGICPSEKAKHTAGERLAGFHEFIMAKFDAPNVDFSDLLIKSGPSELGVDANLLSPAEFDLVKKALARNISRASRVRRIQYLIAILGFRCGLRRREALKLRIIDFQGVAEPELLLRTNRYAYVKSAESTRRIPLKCLLEPDELELLLTWRRERLLEENVSNPDSLLFCMAGNPTTLLPDHEVFTGIVQAMRQVTGDMSLHYHHLRHSFATWLLLRLLKDFSQETRKSLPFLDHPSFAPESCAQLRKAILGNHRLGRQALYAVAQLCGHATPQVTLLHYFHLCDWLLHHELADPCNGPLVDTATIKSVTGLPEHTIYYLNKQNGEDGCRFSSFLERLKVPANMNPPKNLLKPDLSHIPEKDDSSIYRSIPMWRRVEAVLRDRHLSKLAFDELAIRHGFTEQQVRDWCANAEVLSAMKTKMGKPMHMNTVTLKKNPLSQFPVPIHLHADREMAEKVITSFDNLRVSKKKVLHQGVSCFLTHYCASQSAVLFSASSGAKSFIKFLRLIVPAEQIRVRRVVPRTSRRSHASESKSLAKYFSLPCECIKVINLHPTQSSQNGEIHIQVLNMPDGCKDRVKASYGFRYAMYMLGIIYGSP